MTITGLTAIVLHDSYFRGVRTRIACEGHTNNTGDNGAGKTSALNLIPIFYGQEPSKLITRAGNKSNFIEYYLPSNQSMVVFEYSRHTGHYCVCLYRKRNTNHYAYRFIKGRADDTLFHPDYAKFFDANLSTQEILLDLASEATFMVSNQIDSVIDYRYIIQSDYQNLRKRIKNSSLVSYPRRFGIADERARHLGVLTSVVLRRDKLLAQFKTMLIDCFLRDQISLGQAPTNTRNLELIDDLRSLNTFAQHRESILHASEKVGKLIASWYELQQYLRQSEQQLQAIENNEQQLKELKSSLNQRYDQTQTQHNAQLDTFKQQRNDLSLEQESQTRYLDSLKHEKQKYDDQNILQKQQVLSNLDEYRRQAEHQKQLLQDLEQSFAGQKQDFDSKQRKLEHELNQTTARINSDIERVRQQQSVEIEAINQQIEQLRQQHGERLRQLNAEHTEQLDTLKQKAKPIELAIELIKLQVPTEEEAEQRQSLEASINEENEAIKQAQQGLTEIDSRMATLKQEMSDNHQSIAKQEQAKDALKQDIARLEQQLNPADGSLLSMLKASDNPSWQQNIAKVIHPDLIHRHDLNPQWQFAEPFEEKQADSGDTLYGLSLDLTSIAIPNFASDDLTLRQLIKEKSIEIDGITDVLKTLGDEQTRLRQAHQEQTAKRTLAHTNIDHANDRLNKIKQRQTEFEQQCKDNRQTRLQEQQQLLGQHEQSVEDLQNQQSEIKTQIERQNERKIQTLKDDRSHLKDKHEADISAKQTLLREAENDKKRREAVIEQAYQQALQEAGVDTQTLKEAEAKYHELAEYYQTVKGYEPLVEKYTRWYKNEWSQEPVLRQTIEQLDEQLDKLETDIKHKEQELKQLLGNINQERKQVSRRLDNLEIQQDSLTRWHKQASSSVTHLATLQHLIEASIQQHRFPQLQQFANQASPQLNQQSRANQIPRIDLDSETVTWLEDIDALLPKCKNLLKAVQQTAQKLHRDLNPHIGSQLYEAWQNRQNDHRYTTAYGIANGEVNMEMDTSIVSAEIRSLLDIMTLQQVLDEDVEQLQKSIHGSFVSLGIEISNYYQALDSINKTIKKVGNKLAHDINTQHHFDALSDIKINLSSKIHEYDLWQYLQVFEQQYQKWTMAGTQLPDEAFLDSFERVVNALSNSHIELNMDSLVEMTIEITENGRLVPIKTDNDLQHASSTGLSMLAVIVVFCGMTRYLCPDKSVTIHWPLDEIGKLSGKNTVRLFDLMAQHNVTLFCAQPDASPMLNRFFVNKNLLDYKKGVRQFDIQPRSKTNPLLPAHINKGSPSTSTNQVQADPS